VAQKLPPVAAIDSPRIHQIPRHLQKGLTHEECAESGAEIGDGDGQASVEQMQPIDGVEVRGQQSCGGDHQLQQDEEKQQFLAHELIMGEGETGQGDGDELNAQDHGDDDDGVQVVELERGQRHGHGVVREGERAAEPHIAPAQGLGRGPGGGDEGPDDGHGPQQRGDGCESQQRPIAQLGPKSAGSNGVRHEFSPLFARKAQNW